MKPNGTDCESIYDSTTSPNGWALRTYTIFVQNKYATDAERPKCTDKEVADPAKEAADPADGSFIAEVVSVQEHPSVGEANLIWGSGFLLTFLKREIDESSAPFYLDIMFLKNTCESIAAYKPHCQHLAVGINPKDQEEINKETGGTFKNMSEFLQLNVSKCSNYATGMDSTSIIEL